MGRGGARHAKLGTSGGGRGKCDFIGVYCKLGLRRRWCLILQKSDMRLLDNVGYMPRVMALMNGATVTIMPEDEELGTTGGGSRL